MTKTIISTKVVVRGAVVDLAKDNGLWTATTELNGNNLRDWGRTKSAAIVAIKDTIDAEQTKPFYGMA